MYDMIDFVACKNVEEQLLLTLLERIEGLEKSVCEAVTEMKANPLENIKPNSCPSVLHEARYIAARLNQDKDFSFDQPHEDRCVSCHIRYQSNIELLRRQGFEVTPVFRYPLPTDFFNIKWHPGQ